MNEKQSTSIRFSPLIFLIVCVFFYCCKNKNYIAYYHKVYEIDSINRVAKQPEKAVDLYRKLFRKYRPLNQERIEEYETYIKISDKYHKKFGGKKSLYRLIPLIAPYWKYRKQDPELIQLYKKYGIDSLNMEREVAKWEKNLNRKLIDSFIVAYKRDQVRLNNSDRVENDKKNAELLKWTFENYGFPSQQKIGLNHKETFIPMGTILLHMADVEEYHPYFKTKILEYVKSGECPPRDYAAMIDRNNMHHKIPRTYAVYMGYEGIKDSAQVERDRKKIGLPTLNYRSKIIKDFLEKNK